MILSIKRSSEIGADFDENKNVIDWNENGIYFYAIKKPGQAYS